MYIRLSKFFILIKTIFMYRKQKFYVLKFYLVNSTISGFSSIVSCKLIPTSILK